MTDMKARRQAGLPYICDAAMLAEQSECRRKLAEFNDCPFDEKERMEGLLRAVFGRLGSNPWVNSPFRCDYGYNISIGDNVQIAPNVTISAAGHPVHPETRATQYEYGKSVSIGNDVWLGAGGIVNPGVSIGDGAVIGSGSVVTRDIPPMVVAAGAPCRVLRVITEEDRYLLHRGERFDIDPFE